jgi:hypothetical protein
MNKNFLKKIYRNFADFASEASARELEYFILDSKYTSAFNTRMKEMVDGVIKEGSKNIEFSIIFNTEGEISIIDSDIIGRYVGNNYNITIERYYKTNSLNRIVNLVINGNDKNKADFLMISYKILYNTLECIYSEIIFKKETGEKYQKAYSFEDYNGTDLPIIVCTILVLEDICKYLNIKENLLIKCVSESIKK